jgi:ubiquinone/menaquinone biosynthesis C-methylase UbiE
MCDIGNVSTRDATPNLRATRASDRRSSSTSADGSTARAPELPLEARDPHVEAELEEAVEAWYDRTTAKGRGFDQIAKAVVSRLPPGGAVLEVAPGPGYLCIELARHGAGRVAGVDISRSFVRIAGENARRAGVSVELAHGDAAHLPHPDASFDQVVCVAAFKNFTDPVGALDEMYRVLRPGGGASIYDLRKDASPVEIEAEVARMELSPVNSFITRLTFRHFLLRNAYTREALERMAARSRFGGGQILPSGIGLELRLAR